MNIYERVERAVENAPVTNDFIESTNDLTPLADKDDDYAIHLNAGAFSDLPNEVTVDAEQDLGMKLLMEAYRDITDITLSREYIEYAQRHENQHLKAAKYLGAMSARLGVRIFNVQKPGQGSQLTIQPLLYIEDFRTTKFGAALVAAYPIPTSRGDEIDIKAYGYSGIDELADMAMRRNGARKNLESEQFYPVPLGSGSMSERYFHSMSRVPRGHHFLDIH